MARNSNVKRRQTLACFFAHRTQNRGAINKYRRKLVKRRTAHTKHRMALKNEGKTRIKHRGRQTKTQTNAKNTDF